MCSGGGPSRLTSLGSPTAATAGRRRCAHRPAGQSRARQIAVYNVDRPRQPDYAATRRWNEDREAVVSYYRHLRLNQQRRQRLELLPPSVRGRAHEPKVPQRTPIASVAAPRERRESSSSRSSGQDPGDDGEPPHGSPFDRPVDSLLRGLRWALAARPIPARPGNGVASPTAGWRGAPCTRPRALTRCWLPSCRTAMQTCGVPWGADYRPASSGYSVPGPRAGGPRRGVLEGASLGAVV